MPIINLIVCHGIHKKTQKNYINFAVIKAANGMDSLTASEQGNRIGYYQTFLHI